VTYQRLTIRAAGLGALTGLLTAAIAVAGSYLVAGFTGADSGPVVAVGQLAIDQTPPAVKNFAISKFGSNDKQVLLIGIAVVLAIFAAVVGILALRRLWQGMAGLGIFTVIGVIAAVTRPKAGPAYVLPTLAGAALGAIALFYLARAAAPLAAAPRTGGRARPAGQAAPAGPGGQEGAAEQPDLTSQPADRDAAGPADREVAEPPDWDTAGPPDRVPAASGSQPPAGRSAGWRPPAWLGSSAEAEDAGPAAWSRALAPQQPDRRRFVAVGATVAGLSAVGYIGGRLFYERGAVTAAQRSLRLPRPAVGVPALPAGADLKIAGLSSFITPNSSFYRVDTAIVLPEIPPASWSLRIHGMVSRELSLTFDELIRRPLIEDYITLTCVSNPVEGPYIGNALWLGASLRSLLREAGIRAGADQLLCTSADGFTSGSPVQTAMDGRDAMLAVAMNGSALPIAHGFPARMVVPGLYGYVSACKWITDIEVTTYATSSAYWAQRGWSQQAPIKTESRIDVPDGLSQLKPGPTAVAGVAWAQHKGIDAVEVRVDRGPWHQARLAAVPGIDCWRQWVWQWDATPGTHLIEARATDATGYTQTALQEPPVPNGASGYPMAQVSVTGS
jgi:DMSO/TMAO reductase YedYZ molybdopterin-dependent catalytic subunit